MRKKLTNKKINELCDEIIKDVKHAQKQNHSIFLCCKLQEYLGCYSDEITKNIPLFTYENAKIHANADNMGVYSFWWVYKVHRFITGGFDYDESSYLNRIKFLEWIKSQYPVTPKQHLIQKWLQKLINIFK